MIWLLIAIAKNGEWLKKGERAKPNRHKNSKSPVGILFLVQNELIKIL
jgi:hypothetical protein